MPKSTRGKIIQVLWTLVLIPQKYTCINLSMLKYLSTLVLNDQIGVVPLLLHYREKKTCQVSKMDL